MRDIPPPSNQRLYLVGYASAYLRSGEILTSSIPPVINTVSTIRIGTRGSKLARWQADWVASQLKQLGVDVELVPITTKGDVTAGPLGQIGGTGLFTKEIQRALLDDQIDLAVHSLKDLPTIRIEELQLAAVPPREACGDALVCNLCDTLAELPPAARIGTGSMRRKAQLLHFRSDLEVLDIRGNLDTRLSKLDGGEYDAIVLAEAGLRRMQWSDRIASVIPPRIMLPAVGQGALGLEIRTDDQAAREAVAKLNDPASWAAVTAERTMLAALAAGCLAPVGAWGRLDSPEQLRLDVVVLSTDGTQRLAAGGSAPGAQAEQLGRQVAEELLAQGAAALIEAAHP
jgi:hydroxymethylbilane synthase